MRRYLGYSNATNTVSTTVPLFTIVGAATVRVRVYDFISGSDATPADAATKLGFRRISARGTQATSVVANALDPADPAAIALYDTTWNINPTITATSEVLQVAHNQRATFRWVAVPDSEIVIPATAGAGLALMSIVASATANYGWSTYWQE
jgi:hypothetical protein